MKWIAIESSHELPRDGSEFLAIWKGIISLCQYDMDDCRFFIAFQPAIYNGIMMMPQDRENKFTHWMPLPELPEDTYGWQEVPAAPFDKNKLLSQPHEINTIYRSKIDNKNYIDKNDGNGLVELKENDWISKLDNK